jgi:hypothetical protein
VIIFIIEKINKSSTRKLKRTTIRALINSLQSGTKLSLRIIQFLCLFILAFITFRLINTENQVLDIYMARDIRNAYEILKGHWIWYGPDLSGGGKSPGAFYYWLLAAPIYITNSWHWLATYSNLLASAAAVLLWHFLKKNRSELSAYLGYFFFINSYVVLDNITANWNPSYIYIFQLVPIFLLAQKNIVKPIQIAIAFFILGLSIQIHMIQGVFVLAGLIWILSRPGPDGHRLKNFSIAVFSLLIPLVPYLIWFFQEGTKTGVSGSFWFGAKTFLTPASSFYKSHYADTIAVYSKNFFLFFKTLILNDLFFLPSVLMIFYFKKSLRRENLFLYISLLVSSTLLLWIGSEGSFLRYTVPFFVIFCLWSAMNVADIVISKRAKYFWLTSIGATLIIQWITRVGLGWKSLLLPKSFVLVYLVTAGIIYFLSEKKERIILILIGLTLFRLEMDLARDYSVDDDRSLLISFSKTVAQTTGWSYKQFRGQTLIVGVDRESDLSLLYEDALKSPDSHKAQAIESYHGLIAVRLAEANFIQDGKIDWQSLKNLLPEEVVTAGLSNSIVCKKILRTESFQFCFYDFKNKVVKYKWNNIGYAYQYIQPILFQIKGHSGLVLKNQNAAVFYINACPSLGPQCTVYFDLNIFDNQVSFEILGDPVGVPDPAPNPAWVASLQNLSLEFTCDKKTVVQNIVSLVGFESRRATFLAPFLTSIKLPCKNPRQISLRGSGQSIFHSFTFDKLEPFKIDWNRN